MPRRGGNTHKSPRKKHAGHRMHRRGRGVRKLLSRVGRGERRTAWGRWAV